MCRNMRAHNAVGSAWLFTTPLDFFFGAYRADARECVLTRTANIDIAACTATRTATHTATQFYNSDELAPRSLTALHCNTLHHAATHTATRTATHPATQFYNSDELASRIAEAFRLFDTDSDGVVDFQVGAPRD